MGRAIDSLGAPLLTIKDVARYLNVNDRTVLRLAGEDGLPAVRIGNQWRFRRESIDAWLDDQMLGVSRTRLKLPVLSPHTPRLFGLEDCFCSEQVLASLDATTAMGAIVELASAAEELGLVRSATWFTGALVQREAMLSSAVGARIAFPHTVGRNPEHVVRPFLLLGRSLQGIEFRAQDGLPVHFFFVLGLHYQELQLPWLARLSRLMWDSKLFDAMLSAEGADDVYELLRSAEQSR